MDTILINEAYILAGDSKFRLSSREDRGQAPTLSFTYNPASNLVFMHLDGDFFYNRTGYYPEANSLELFLDLHCASILCGVLKNVVTYTTDPGESPEIPEWKHGPDSPLPVIIEEYTVQARSIAISHPLDLALKPRTNEGFTTYVALTHPRTSEHAEDIAFRLKFWLTERSIPELDRLQSFYRHSTGTRTQPMHITFSFSGDELAHLQRQLEVLKVRYTKEIA